MSPSSVSHENYFNNSLFLGCGFCLLVTVTFCLADSNSGLLMFQEVKLENFQPQLKAADLV